MNTKTLLGVSLAATLAISMVGAASAVSDFFGLVSGTAIDTDDGFQGTAVTDAKIPRKYQDIPELQPVDAVGTIIVGYGWVNTNNGEGFLAAIHPFFNDSTQNPKAWHTHPVTLSPNDNNGPLSEGYFCIADLRSSQAGLALTNDGILVNVDTTNGENDYVGIEADDVNKIVSFTAELNADCPEFAVETQNEHNNFSLLGAGAGVLVHVEDGVDPTP